MKLEFGGNTDADTFYNEDRLHDRYDDWRDRRADQSELEAEGRADADDWYALDDEGCDLAERFATAAIETDHELALLMDAGRNVLRSWDNGNLAGAVRDLNIALDDLGGAV